MYLLTNPYFLIICDCVVVATVIIIKALARANLFIPEED